MSNWRKLSVLEIINVSDFNILFFSSWDYAFSSFC